MRFTFLQTHILEATFIAACLIGQTVDALAQTRGQDNSTQLDTSRSPFAAYVGRYYMHGVRDVGAELTLAADGQFTFLMSYGAVDRSAKGRWTIQGPRLTLVTDPTPPASLKLQNTSNVVASPYADPGEKKTLLVVEVISSNFGMVWSNMQVTAEFSNSKQRSGHTGRNGLIGFDQRDDDEWKDAHITRVRVEYPRVKADSGWLEVKHNDVKTMTVNFEPGELIPPAFKVLELDVALDSKDRVSLVLAKEDGEPVTGVKFSR